MKLTVVRYRTKPEATQENERLIQQVFQELQAKSLPSVRYLAMRLDDDTFIHFSTVENGDSPIPKLKAFGLFQSGIKERCVEPPRQSAVTIVGSFRMLGET
jgi:hypothetical protein